MMMERIKRWRWALILGGLLVAGLAFAFWPQATPVDEAEVTRGAMRVGITDDGVTRVLDLYTVSAPVTGYVTRIELDPGDEVVANQTVIARMAGVPSTPLDVRSRTDVRDALVAARSAERGIAASLDLARSDLERARKLAERGFFPKAQLEAAGTLVLTREADLRRAQAEIRRLAGYLDEPAASGLPDAGPVTVRSPESGVVLRRLAESEGVIAMGSPLVEIGDPRRIEVVIDLLSREAARVRPGAPVEITRWGGSDPLRGKVRRVEPFGRLKVSALGIEEQRVNVIVDFAPEAAAAISALGHGYQVDGTIILWSEPDVLRVPVGALFRGKNGGWRVFVDEGGRAREREVKVGHLNERHGEVLGGLAEGDAVVLNPGNMVEDGIRLRRR